MVPAQEKPGENKTKQKNLKPDLRQASMGFSMVQSKTMKKLLALFRQRKEK